MLWRLIPSSVGEGEKCIAYTIEETAEAGKYEYKYKVDKVDRWLRADGTYLGSIDERAD